MSDSERFELRAPPIADGSDALCAWAQGVLAGMMWETARGRGNVELNAQLLAMAQVLLELGDVEIAEEDA